MISQAVHAHDDHLLCAGDVVIDLRQRIITIKEMPIVLTRREFDILLFLVRHSGWAITKHQILDAAWENDSEISDHAVENMIYRIRKRLSASEMVSIQTLVGYGSIIKHGMQIETTMNGGNPYHGQHIKEFCAYADATA